VTAEEVVRSYFDAIARRDLDGLASHYDEELIVDMPVGVMRGAGEMREFFRSLFEAIPDVETTVAKLVAGTSGDDVVVEWRMRGNFTGGQLNGIEATGNALEFRGCDVIEVRDGKITRNDVYQDAMELARGVGMMPPQGSAAERGMIQAFNLATRARKALKERFA
jgi:steroid delta-isomerase-like uncharacterized protein